MMFFAIGVMAENLLKNGEFNTIRLGGELYAAAASGSVKLSNFAQVENGNRCLKLEIMELKTSEDGRKSLSSEVVFGKNGNTLGLAAEPDTVYDFSFDCQGDLQLSLWVSLDSKPIEKTYFSEKRIRPVPKVFKGTAGKWRTCQGEFKTAADTKYIRLHLMLWGDSKQQSNFSLKPGDVVLIDNVKIIKRKANK